jgi:hypothetical protein
MALAPRFFKPGAWRQPSHREANPQLLKFPRQATVRHRPHGATTLPSFRKVGHATGGGASHLATMFAPGLKNRGLKIKKIPHNGVLLLVFVRRYTTLAACDLLSAS